MKSSGDLARLRKPVKTVDYDDFARNVPPQLQDLVGQVKRLCGHKGIFPASMRPSLIELDEALDENFYFDTHFVPQNAARDFESLNAIILESKWCHRFGVAEASWNQEVHYPLLKLAFAEHNGLRPEPM